ncbi:hypothetical protein [Flavobacterium sp.]|uniref:hypothetical protein n=1 Tax=Flavobacterium sp. TaxID=239 RepID=UPI0026242ACA|nr:hypothetical protein [Flavobacterium sp.]MDG2431944.1 hypothetical protein [Flavobacterium sp.]
MNIHIDTAGAKNRNTIQEIHNHRLILTVFALALQFYNILAASKKKIHTMHPYKNIGSSSLSSANTTKDLKIF